MAIRDEFSALARSLGSIFTKQVQDTASALEAHSRSEDMNREAIAKAAYDMGHDDMNGIAKAAIAGLRDEVAQGKVIAKVDWEPMIRKAIPGMEGDTRSIPAFPDQFNVPDKGNKPRTPTGPNESASGNGATRMIATYSPDADEGQSALVQAYAELARAMESQSMRLEATENAISSMSALLAAVLKGERFPASEMKRGDESDESEDEDKKREDEEEKADLDKSGTLRIRQIASVPALMEQLMKTSRGPSLPPQLYKAHVPTPVDSGEDTIEAATLRMRARAKQAGMPVAEHLLKSGASHTPFDACDIGNQVAVAKNNGVWR
jgi:hypothetical protein